MAIKAYLFDLDMTLLNTSALAVFRDQHKWKLIAENLNLIQVFEGEQINLHELPMYYKNAGYKTAIVTSSPTGYARAVMDRFGISCDGLITYSSTANHKPDPEPIIKAMKELQVDADECIYIGDDEKDFEACFRAGVTCIGAGWGMKKTDSIMSYAPDYLFFTDVELFQFDGSDRFGYLLEGDLEALESKALHKGSFLHWVNDLSCYSFGRYFKESDPRHQYSRLSQNILDFKDNPTNSPYFARAIVKFISKMKKLQRPLAITCVPPNPGETNRFSEIFGILSRIYTGQDILLYPNGLIKTKVIEGYKGKKAAERVESQKDAYATIVEWPQNVILIDDVYTTGSTIQECAQLLSQHGAQRVVPLTFAKTQYGKFLQRKICPICGAPMVIRRNKSDNSRFWGCSNFARGKCRYHEPLAG